MCARTYHVFFLFATQVILTTAQCVLNFLRHGLLRLGAHTLVVFHECHLATGHHPYNHICNDFLHSAHACAHHSRAMTHGHRSTSNSNHHDDDDDDDNDGDDDEAVVSKQRTSAAVEWQNSRPVVFGTSLLPLRHRRQVKFAAVLPLLVRGLEINFAAEFFGVRDFIGAAASDGAGEQEKGALITHAGGGGGGGGTGDRGGGDSRALPTAPVALVESAVGHQRHVTMMPTGHREVLLRLPTPTKVQWDRCQHVGRLLTIVRRRTDAWLRATAAMSRQSKSRVAPSWTAHIKTWRRELTNVQRVNDSYGAFCALSMLSRCAEEVGVFLVD